MNSTGQPNYSADIVRHGIYVAQGTALVLTNSLLFGTIARHTALREEKEYLLVAGLALSDSISGMGTFTAGLWRLPKLLTNSYSNPTSRRACFFSPHNLLWVFANPLSAILILLTSLDRCFVVVDPLRYLSLDIRYSYFMLGSAYAYCTAQMLYFGFNVWPSTSLDVQARCLSGESVLPSNFTFYQTMSLWATLLSIVLYVCLITVNRRRINKVATGLNVATDKEKLKRQGKLTRTLFLSSLCDVLFYALPNGVLWLVATYFYNSPINNWLGPSMWIVQGVNPMLNLLIFGLKQQEIRNGMKALFCCKTMPPTLDAWKANSRQSRVKNRRLTHKHLGLDKGDRAGPSRGQNAIVPVEIDEC